MVVVVGALVLTSGRGGEPTNQLGIVRPPDSTIATYAEGDGLGPMGAPVTLEVWSDYQCPVCGRFAREYLPRLVNTFVAAGELRIVERSIDILGAGDPNESLDAAAGASCAGQQGAYWQFHDILMWNQDGENERAFSRDRLAAMATQVGLDRDELMSCVDDPAVRSAITDRTRQAAADGIDRTPTFVVNGERVVGLLAYADLEAMIQAAVDTASAGS
jgi:protein-disulfide isomerase